MVFFNITTLDVMSEAQALLFVIIMYPVLDPVCCWLYCHTVTTDEKTCHSESHMVNG